MSDWTIIQTFHSEPIHLDHLKKSNPDAEILFCDISNYSFLDTHYCWRNNDTFVRNWLRQHRSKITKHNVAILEWDVLITKKMPDSKIDGLVCKNIKDKTINTKWPWFKESSLLGPYKPYIKGVAPFGVLFMDQKCIDIWIDNEFDPLHSCDIFCEIRLPTILNSKNIKMTEFPMPNVNSTKVEFTNLPDIYHPIKHKIYTSDT